MISTALLFFALQVGPVPASPAPLPTGPATGPVAAPAAPEAAKPAITTASGLKFQVLEAGSGASPESGDAVLLLYEGKLADGTVFDSITEPTGLPVSGVVPGFEEALLMMNVGGTYRIWLPPHLAYGAEGAGGGAIPPNATLEFLVAVLDVRSAAALAEQAPPQPAE